MVKRLSDTDQNNTDIEQVKQLGIGKPLDNTAPFTSHSIQIRDDDGNMSDILQMVADGASTSYNVAASGGTIASPSTSALGTASLAIRVWAYGASAWKEAAQIISGVDDANNGGTTPTNTSMPGYIIFRTTPLSSVTPLEAMRINNKQWVGLNNTTVLSRFDNDGSIGLAITNKTANFTATSANYTLTCDATSGNITATLPTASTVTRRIYLIVKTDASANTVTANGVVLESQGDSVIVQSNGTSWVNILTNVAGSSSGITEELAIAYSVVL